MKISVKELKKENEYFKRMLARNRTATFCSKCNKIIFSIEPSFEIMKTKPEKIEGYGCMMRRRHKIGSYHVKCWKLVFILFILFLSSCNKNKKEQTNIIEYEAINNTHFVGYNNADKNTYLCETSYTNITGNWQSIFKCEKYEG